MTREKGLRITRREVLKLAGFSVAGATLGIACGDGGGGGDDGSSSEVFPNLFTPLSIGTFTVRNRILSTAHFTGYANQGLPSERHKNYWGSKARGGIGLILTEASPIHPTAGIFPAYILCYRDGLTDAFKPIVDEVHAHGARLIAQIAHPGKSMYEFLVSELVSPSAIPSETYGGTPRALTVDEIHELVRSYAESAARMREAGVDGVEVHCAHLYLPQQFMSPLHNIRTDEYGGSEENRLRFTLEIIDAVRSAVGDDFTFGIRITGDEFAEGGLRLEDMKRIVPTLTASGKLDYLNVSLDGPDIIAPMGRPHGVYVYLAEGIKEVVNLPVFCIGRITEPAFAESIVAEGRADMVGMTRANMTDPELPAKARAGRVGEIRPCIGLMVCVSRAGAGGVTCALNPSVGHETEFEITPAETTKRVMVVGGGASGMEAARVAAERGHWVTLYEKEDRLGGQLLAAARAPTRGEMERPIVYFQNQFDRLGVEVRLGTLVTKELVEQENPDAVIVATGGLPKRLSVPGADAANVVQGRDVLLGLVETGQRVVVVASDLGMEGPTTADFLAERGKTVEVLMPQASATGAVEERTGFYLFGRLDQAGVTLTTKTTVLAIEGSTVIVSTDGEERRIEGVDTVVLSLGSVSSDALLGELGDIVGEVHAVGQCRKVGKLLDSTLDGLRAGRVL